MRRIFRPLDAVSLALSIAACSDGGSPAPAGDASLSFNLATRAVPVAAASAALAAPESYTDGAGNILVFDRVQLVLREVELENDAANDACELAGGSDDCAEVEVGPFLVDLPLGTPGAARAFTADIPAGTYDEVQFKIREPDDDAADAAFRAAHPDFVDVSVRAEGSYNGVPFVFVSRLEAELELDLVPPLVVDGTATTDLTLMVDLGAWFSAADGTLVDPATANQGGANQELVAGNVARAFDAFEDHDHDGSDDHGGDDSGSGQGSDDL
ncbi:MAG TPA: hypothetical protein VFT84_14385 [Gemmatimonadales bacterium]|nr:hypothetical protein [Gemmatimonadales bacterium]